MISAFVKNCPKHAMPMYKKAGTAFRDQADVLLIPSLDFFLTSAGKKFMS